MQPFKDIRSSFNTDRIKPELILFLREQLTSQINNISNQSYFYARSMLFLHFTYHSDYFASFDLCDLTCLFVSVFVFPFISTITPLPTVILSIE